MKWKSMILLSYVEWNAESNQNCPNFISIHSVATFSDRNEWTELRALVDRVLNIPKSLLVLQLEKLNVVE